MDEEKKRGTSKFIRIPLNTCELTPPTAQHKGDIHGQILKGNWQGTRTFSTSQK